jgi:hypothetical protein
MVSTPKLTMAVSTDTAGLVLFRFFLLASVVWVTALVAAAREAGILPIACRVRRGAETLDDALHVAGA